MRRVRTKKNKRGGTIVLVAVSMVALIGMAGMVIDIGMLLKVRGEAQRAADAAALGGASAFLLDIGRAAESTQVVTRARQLADTNYMDGQAVDSLSEVIVTVLYDSQKVRVKVRRAAIPVWFARIFGMNDFPVGAEAAAVADYAGGALCTKPIALLDMWDDLDDDVVIPNNLPDPGEDWEWDPGDIYGRYNPSNTPPQTGYGTNLRDMVGDWGRRVILRDQGNVASNACLDTNGNKCLRPGYWGLWGLPGEVKTPDLRAAMATCRTRSAYVDSTYQTHPGEVSTVVNKPIETIWDDDPTASWDPTKVDAVTGRTGTILSKYSDWRQSPRAWIMALFDPGDAPSKANSTIKFNNFGLFFFEGCSKNGGVTLGKKCTPQHDIYGRYMGLAQGSGPGGGTLTRILRLVE